NALCFSPDSRLFFIEKLKNEQRIHAFIFTKDFLHSSPKSYEFATKPFKGGKEETIEEDASPPNDYEYFFLRRVKSYDSAASARFVFKNLTTRDSNAYLSFHWLDSAGSFYSHLKEADFRRLICELTLTDESGQKIPIDTWQLSEHHPNEQLAIALVLDHSGSMGEARAVLLQQGVEALLRNKRPLDSIALIRYDNRAEVFSDLTHHLSNLLSKNPINGLRGFGGGTALLDATHAGIMTLAKDASKKKRLLVLFTDGMENSSWLTKEEVIQDALRYGVSIHTVGFGEQIDETLLRLLAEATQGTYYRIFQSNFLTDILTDIYQKINHFYTISLPIPSSGNYLLRVKFCHENQKPFETTLQHYRPELVDSDDLSAFYLGELEELSEKEESNFKQIDEKEIVYFRFDFHRIEPQDEEKIERIALLLKENPHLRVALYGHTDNVGSDAYNNQLSWRRATEVKQRLLQLGIESHRIETKGWGASLPITSNETEEGRAKNRRTEIVIIRQ
ncbi:MAG: OmpA family protein, partial [Flammeovirgaceae bacterium]|nr:OmpA family protein [Flammeovirgaceae bacterium]